MGQICGSVNKKHKKHSENVHKLNEKEIEFLVQHTNYDRSEILEWHQEFLKDSPDAKLNKKLFIKQYKKFNSANNVEKLCDYLFRAFDADHNGFIGKISFYIF